MRKLYQQVDGTTGGKVSSELRFNEMERRVYVSVPLYLSSVIKTLELYLWNHQGSEGVT